MTKIYNAGLFRHPKLQSSAKKCLLGLGISTAHMTPNTNALSHMPLPLVDEVRNIKAKKLLPKTLSWEEASGFMSNTNKEFFLSKSTMAKIAELNIIKKQRNTVLNIIQEDLMCAPNADKNKIANHIVNVAKEYDADPIHIACIAKKETHFTENIKSYNGQGMMQITYVSIQDMFKRPDIYHKKLSEIKQVYPSPQKLYAALKHNNDLNLRIGTILFQSQLTIAKGNIHKALKSYNGSALKESYASIIMNDIKKYKS